MRTTLALLAITLVACDPAPPETDAGPMETDAGEVALEVGTGEGAFRSIEPGDTLDLVSGCQGSQHVWVGARAWGIERRGTILDLALTRDRDDMVVSQAFHVRISLHAVPNEPYAEVTGLTLIVPEPAEALEEDLTLRVTVRDANDVELSDERPVRIAWDETGGCG